MSQYIKNFPIEEVVNLAGQIAVRPGEVVSKTLAQNDAVSVTLFAFDKGEEISAHESIGDAFVTVLEGVGEYTVGGKKYEVHAGESLVMPANVPHAVFAKEAFKWLLVVVFPKGFEG
ncbi:MAG: cupin domain-containing protein [Acetatifactor sp.]|nr:cupin domain-containing protein [Acetatifactor sp.]